MYSRSSQYIYYEKYKYLLKIYAPLPLPHSLKMLTVNKIYIFSLFEKSILKETCYTESNQTFCLFAANGGFNIYALSWISIFDF